jgi:hypothetical protein
MFFRSLICSIPTPSWLGSPFGKIYAPQALVESVPFGERIASLESVLSAMEAEVESEPVVV